MKYFALLSLLFLTACSENKESNIPTTPADPRIMQKEQIQEVKNILGFYIASDSMGKEITLLIKEDGTFTLNRINSSTQKAEIIEGLFKGKGDRITIVDFDEKFIRTYRHTEANTLIPILQNGVEGVVEVFTKTDIANYKKSTEPKEAEQTPKQNVITDPAELSKIKKIKDSASK